MKLLRNLLSCLMLATTLTSCGGEPVSKELTIVHFDQSILSAEMYEGLGVSIGIKKDNTDLQSKLNTALASLSTETRNEWMNNAIARADGTTTSYQDFQVTTDTSKPVLTVGLECDYAPFNWTETKQSQSTYPIKGASGQYADGYDIQVAKFLANQMDYRLEIVKLEWDALIPALNNGSINAVIAGMTDTEERRQSISFTNEYYRSELVLVVLKEGAFANATKIEDFSGARIVSQIKTVTNDVIDEWKDLGVKHLNPMKTFGVCAMSVQRGKADAMTAELPVATSIVNGSK